MLDRAAASFFALLALHVCLALSYKYAQHGPLAEYSFSPAIVLMFSELVKLYISVGLLYREGNDRRKIPPVSYEHKLVRKRPLPSFSFRGVYVVTQDFQSQVTLKLVWKTALLAIFYSVNNNLTFVIFQRADSANIALMKSTSSVVSAILLRFGLDRAISSTQWSAVWLQACGLVVTQFGTTCSNTPLLPWYVYSLLLLSLLISSFCGVWNDHILKDSSKHGVSMHLVNILLYGYGFLLNAGAHAVILGGCRESVTLRSSECRRMSMLTGFDEPSTYLVLMCQSFLGLAISNVYKYADATVKTFALSCATCVLMTINVIFGDNPINLIVAMGCMTIFISTHLYVRNPPAPCQPKVSQLTEWTY